MPLLQHRARRRLRAQGQGLRRDQRHQPAGAGPRPRDPGAPRRHLPRGRRLRCERIEAHARIRRRDGREGRAERVPRGRQRRAQRRADGVPPALAHPRRRAGLGRRGAVRRRDGGGRGRMTLVAELEQEVKDAMLARDAERRDALRLILSSLKSAEKELLRPLTEEEELQVLQRERKKRTEAAEAFRAAGREEQAEKEEGELAVLEEFMPEPLSEDEIDRIVDDAIAENGATSLRDIGRVMADVMPQVAGRADGSAVSQLVREKLA